MACRMRFVNVHVLRRPANDAGYLKLLASAGRLGNAAGRARHRNGDSRAARPMILDLPDAMIGYTGPRYLFHGWSAELCYTD